jgi:hypothetical protein
VHVHVQQLITASGRQAASFGCCKMVQTPAVDTDRAGIFVFGYCFYYYLFRSDMSGFMQTSFYFGAPLLILMPALLLTYLCVSTTFLHPLAGYMALICYGEACMMR